MNQSGWARSSPSSLARMRPSTCSIWRRRLRRAGLARSSSSSPRTQRSISSATSGRASSVSPQADSSGEKDSMRFRYSCMRRTPCRKEAMPVSCLAVRLAPGQQQGQPHLQGVDGAQGRGCLLQAAPGLVGQALALAGPRRAGAPAAGPAAAPWPGRCGRRKKGFPGSYRIPGWLDDGPSGGFSFRGTGPIAALDRDIPGRRGCGPGRLAEAP